MGGRRYVMLDVSRYDDSLVPFLLADGTVMAEATAAVAIRGHGQRGPVVPIADLAAWTWHMGWRLEPSSVSVRSAALTAGWRPARV